MFFSLLLRRRCLIHLCRQTISLSKCLTSNFNSRSINTNESNKKRIMMKINNAINETEPLLEDGQSSEGETLTCLNNELILSERQAKYPFYYRTLLEQQLQVCSDRQVSSDEWKELYQIVGDETKPLFASITMHVCLQLKHLKRGRSLFTYIEKMHPNSLTNTVTTCATYMNLLANDFFTLTNKKHCQDYSTDENEIIRVYEKFVKTRKQPIIASTAASSVLKGLCVTRFWHDAYSYLPFINDDQQYSAMTNLILAALHNDDLPTAKKFLINLKNSPSPDSAAATMSSSLNETIVDIFRNLNDKNPQAFDFMEDVFRYLSSLDTFIEQSAIIEMKKFLAKYPPSTFHYGTTLVLPSGACKELPGLVLQMADLSQEEFKVLRDYLMDTAYAKDEVYNTTTPEEFKRFQTILDQHKFTMIIDGLNILYGIDRFATDPVKSMIKSINFLKNLRVSQNQMLFVARKHALSRIPVDIQRDLRSICQVFLVDNTSRDDWFVLYAALQCKAYVLTSDILRKERGFNNKSSPAKNPQINELLQKWLYRYQYMFVRQNNRAFFKQPMGYKLKAQCTKNVWLIPYFNEKPVSLAQRPDQWFFLHQTSKRPPLPRRQENLSQ